MPELNTQRLTECAISLGGQIALALVALLLGRGLAGRLASRVDARLEQRPVAITLRRFLRRLIVVGQRADHAVNFTLRAWSVATACWDAYRAMQAAVKKRCDAVGLKIPYPARDVHLHAVAS